MSLSGELYVTKSIWGFSGIPIASNCLYEHMELTHNVLFRCTLTLLWAALNSSFLEVTFFLLELYERMEPTTQTFVRQADTNGKKTIQNRTY